MKKLISIFLIAGVAAIGTIGCAKDTANSASVKVAFKNAAAVGGASLQAFGQEQNLFGPNLGALTALTSGVDALVFKMKLVAMYIVEDVDPVTSNNVGALTRIWTSSKCDADLTYCGIGPGAGAYVVEDFDFAKSSADVNTTLNSFNRVGQENTVNPGTYRYIRLDFKGMAHVAGDATATNMTYGPTVGGTVYTIRAQTGNKDVKLTTPLVIASGGSFTVNLAYDLSKSYYATGDAAANTEVTAAGRKLTCATGNAGSDGTECMAEPEWVPTITTN